MKNVDNNQSYDFDCRDLKETCHICKTHLVVYWATYHIDYPELYHWTVRCNNAKCDYQDNITFSDLEEVKKSYIISE